MYQFNLTPCEFDMSHQEGTTKNAFYTKQLKWSCRLLRLNSSTIFATLYFEFAVKLSKSQIYEKSNWNMSEMQMHDKVKINTIVLRS